MTFQSFCIPLSRVFFFSAISLTPNFLLSFRFLVKVSSDFFFYRCHQFHSDIRVAESFAGLTAFPRFHICHKDASNILGLRLRKVPKRRSLIRAFRDSCNPAKSPRKSFDGIVRYALLEYTLMSLLDKKENSPGEGCRYYCSLFSEEIKG